MHDARDQQAAQHQGQRRFIRAVQFGNGSEEERQGDVFRKVSVGADGNKEGFMLGLVMVVVLMVMAAIMVVAVYVFVFMIMAIMVMAPVVIVVMLVFMLMVVIVIVVMIMVVVVVVTLPVVSNHTLLHPSLEIRRGVQGWVGACRGRSR